MAVVILNWNRAEDTCECLASLNDQTFKQAIIIVVDNGSTDGSAEKIRERFPSVEVIASAANVGFAAGANIGIRRALEYACEYVFLLNNDTVLEPRCLENLLSSQSAGASISAPAIYYYSDPRNLWSAGARRVGLLPRDLKALDLRGQSTAVDFVTGCAMLVHRSVLDTVGLLDESFFMYYEDNDFCARSARAGFGIIVIRCAIVYHKVGVSLREASATEHYLRINSGLRYYRRELTGWRVSLVPAWLVLRLARLLWRGQWAAVNAALTGAYDAARGVCRFRPGRVSAAHSSPPQS